MDYAASRVAFIVDGDAAGLRWKESLREAGVPVPKIRQLPTGTALEDLLDRDYYLGIVADLGLIDRADLSELDGDLPIKSSLEKWARSKGTRLPGAVAIAEFILGQHESGARPIRLDSTKKKTLVALDNWANKTLAQSS